MLKGSFDILPGGALGLAACDLLHETRSHTDWTDWANDFPEAGIKPAEGQDFPNIDIATKAAVMGFGVVMADLVLCREELESGTLIAPFPDMVCQSPLGGICLIGGTEKWTLPKVEAFRSWAHHRSELDRASVDHLVQR